MQTQTLAVLLPKIRTDDCIVRFTDGDSYPIGRLDILGYFEDDGTFEIAVQFRDCLDKSLTETKAIEEGYLKTRRVSWTSTKPHLPVGKTYVIEEIESVFDRDRNFALFERHDGRSRSSSGPSPDLTSPRAPGQE